MNLTDQILERDTISIIIEKELPGECCIRGYHVYKDNDWLAQENWEHLESLSRNKDRRTYQIVVGLLD